MKIAFVFCALFSGTFLFFNPINCSTDEPEVEEKLKGLQPVDYEKVSVLAPCLLTLSKKYFKSKRASRGSLVVINLVPHPRNFLQRRILEAMNEDENHAFGVMVKDGRLKHLNATAFGVTDKALSYLLLMLVMDDLGVTLNQWKSLPTWNPLAQTVIVFMNPINSIEQKNLLVKQVFDDLLELGMIYANVLYQMADDPNTLLSESWFPYLNDGCARTVSNIYEVDACHVVQTFDDASGKYLREETLKDFAISSTPKLPDNFHDCPLHISTFIWEPFVVGNDTKIESGLEILMLEAIAKQMQMKLEFKVLNDTIAAAKISEDNKTGIYADLIQKNSDIMVGGLYENKISRKLVSASIPYYQDDITWCVAKAGLSPTWLNVFIIFNVWTWIGLLATLIISAYFLSHFIHIEGNYHENFMWSFLVTMSISLGQYGHYWPVKTAIKILMATMFFFGLHINTAYHSSLINVLTNPRYDEQIDTAEKAISAGLIFEVGENTVEFFEKDDTTSKYLRSHHKICHDLDECFKEISKSQTKALAVSRSHAQNNPYKLIENEDFFCFPISDDIVIYSAVMMFKKFHHLLPTMDDKIRVIAESGLLTKWQKDSKSAGKKKVGGGGGGEGKSASSGHGSVQMKLKVDHVEGAFYTVIIGLSIAALIFLFEIFIHRWSSKKKTIGFVKKFEKLFFHA